MLAGCGGGDNGGGDGDAGGGDSEETFEFTLATGATAGTPNEAVQDWFLDRVEEETDGRITFERTATEALCKMQEVVDCVRDGRAQIGVTVPDYTPQYFPSTSMVSIPFLSQNSAAVTQTIHEIHTEFEPAQQIMTNNGLFHISTWPAGRFLFGSNEPIESVGDLAGWQARSSGPIIQQVLSDAGVNVVATTAGETYEAVQRGVIEGVGGAIDFPVNYRLMELLPYWTDPGVGQYSVFGMWFSREAYDSLPDDLKEIVNQVTEELNSGAGIEAFNEVAAGQCQEMLDSPDVEELDRWSEEATEEWQSQVGEQGKQMWVDLATEQGLENAQEVLDRYVAGLEEHSDMEYTDATIECVDTFASE
ncbi:TRAP transporter substrate-binding protein DctP [Georgenia sp. H159]|uniref:TRAP transporter substrate-binding protein DctP n=1 Tax=Georgenia sp. H159 TaxID=3076115 RepID=UPI002D77B3AC|nr:TRAP transporter substrate-binding protein DctP [Georgenia sp. H159]